MKKKNLTDAKAASIFYTLYIKLAQNTKLFRRFVLKKFISVINSFNGRKSLFMGSSPNFLACHFHIMCRVWSGIYMQNLLLAHSGGVILNKIISDFDTFQCKTECSPPKIASFKHLIWKTDSTIIEYSSQGT